ncbi:MAG: TonB-dependent receptor [Brumimicrobium sp.]|nr:TonB-dependent receptor [Brumimicrobium sp.]
MFIYREIVVFLFSFCSIVTVYSQNFTLSGNVTDKESGETLSDVKVVVPEKNQGTYTNTDGFYSLTLPGGKYFVEFRYLGYENQKIQVELSSSKTVNISLNKEQQVQDFEEVTITGEGRDANVKETQVGVIKLEMEEIKTLPAFLGEVDIIKTLQLMPGVQTASEGTQGFYVRGGGPDQNLVLLDGTNVYNASHLFGFFSVFNVDAIKDVELLKAGIPPKYGGRLSSVLNINSNNGNNQRFGVKGGVGLISSRLTVEGPLVKDKASFLIAGRRTYLDVITKPFMKEDGNFSGTGYYFYDLNLKLNYKLGDKDKIFFSGYYGKDDFTFSTGSENFSVDMPWGNAVASLRWSHLFSDKFFVNTSLSLTDYQFSFISNQDEFQFGLKSGIRDYGASLNFSYLPNPRHKIEFGVDYLYHIFTPVSVSANQDTTSFDVGEGQKLFGHESAVYVSDEFNITEKWSVNGGVRLSTYQHVGPFKRFEEEVVGVQDSSINYPSGEVIASYFFLEPRLSSRYLLNDKSSLKVGWNRNAQYVHLANLSAVSLPTDIWYPTTDVLEPQYGWQSSVGYFRNFHENMFESSVEIYYKEMNNLVEFKEGVLPQDNAKSNTDNLLTQGIGYSAGLEFFFKKNLGQLTGWLGYTLSRTERKFEEIFNNKYFPAKYDRRHDLSVVANYKLNQRFTFGAAFVYATGNAITLPVSWYLHNGDLQFEFQDRNASRMPPYHRLDVSVTFYDKPMKTVVDENTGKEISVKKRFRNSLNLSVYNVYSRQNPFFLYVENGGTSGADSFQLSVRQVSLFPILPSITWNFQF